MPSASATCRTMAHASFEASEWMRSVARVDRASRPRCGFRSWPSRYAHVRPGKWWSRPRAPNGNVSS